MGKYSLKVVVGNQITLPRFYLFLVAFVVLICSSAVAIRIPLSVVVYPLYVVVLLLGLSWILAKGSISVSRYHLLVSLLVLAGCCYILAPYLGEGFWGSLGSANADGWNHISRGQYIWYYARGTEGGLPPIDQYASHTSNSRWGCSSLLAFLSVFKHAGDPSSVVVLFFLITLLGIYAGNFLLASALHLDKVSAHALGFFSLTFGWIGNVINVGNYENLLFLVFCPAIVAQLLHLREETSNWIDIIFCAVLCAAALQGYPEGSAIFFVTLLPFVFFLPKKMPKVRFIFYRMAPVAVITFLLVLVILPNHIRFFQRQATKGSQEFLLKHGSRPGTGCFPGLISSSFLPAAFSLGEELRNRNTGVVTMSFAIVLAVFLSFGMNNLRKISLPFSLCGVIILILVVWQAVFQKYNYGLYKVINVSSWWWGPGIFFGIHSICSRMSHKGRRVILYVLVLLMPALLFLERKEDNKVISSVPRQKYADLTRINEVLQGRPLIHMVDNRLAYIWSVYFLRESPIVLTGYRSYMNSPGKIRLLKRAYTPPNYEHALYLSDRPQAHPVWTNGSFYLSDKKRSGMASFENSKCVLKNGSLFLSSKGVYPNIEKVTNPNGLESMNRLPFIWVGDRPTILMISVPREGTYLLTARKFIPGPSIPDCPVRTIQVLDSHGKRAVEVDKKTSFLELRLKQGLNKVEMVCLDAPKITLQPNGDKRPLLLGIQGYGISKK